MTPGRQFGSTIRSVGDRARPSRPRAPSAIGSTTSPSVPTWSALGRRPKRGQHVVSPRPGADVSARWNRYVATPRSSSSAMASVVGASVVTTRPSSTPSASSDVAQRSPPNRSVERQPRNATSPPSRADRPRGVERPAARDGVQPSVRVDDEVDERLARDDDHAVGLLRIGPSDGATAARRHASRRRVPSAARRVACGHDGPPDRRPPSCSTARSTIRRRWPATCATCAGSIAGSAASALSVGRDRRPRRASRRDSSMLDVGTGGADIPMALLARRRPSAAGRLRVVGLDSRPEVLAAAALADRRRVADDRRPRRSRSATGGRSPTPIDAFDVVHASLVLHHLDGDEAVALLARDGPRRAARGRRQRPATAAGSRWLGAWLLGHLLTGNRYTRHDAPLSVRRAYRVDEALELVRGGRPDAGPDDPRPLPAPLRDRGGADARTAATARSRSASKRARETGPVEHVEVAIVGGGPAGAVLAARLAAIGREVVVLERAPAWRWRAGGVFTSPAAVAALAARRSRPRRPGRGRPADPGDARRDARRDDLPTDLRRRRRRPARRRVRPVAARSRLLELAAAAGCVGPPRLGGHARWTRSGDAVAVAARGRRRRRCGPTSSSAPTGSARSWRGRPASPGRPGSTPRLGLTYHLADPGPAAAARRPDAPGPRRLRRDRAGARRPGQRRDRARPVVAARRSPATAPGPSRTGSSPAIPPADDDPAAWRVGHPDRRGRRRVADRPSRDAPGRTRLAARRRRGRVPRPVHRGGAAPGARLGRAGRRGHRRAGTRAPAAPSTPTTAR